MRYRKTPAPKRAGNTMTADGALEMIGDDPETLILAIRLLDRMAHNRRSRRSRRVHAESY